MKIVHITRSLIVNSGVSVFAAELAGAQAELGDDVTLIYRWFPGCEVSRKVRVIENRRVVHELAKINSPDVVHIHALWSLEVVWSMYWCWLHRVRYVVSPHGGLMPRVFKKGRLKKALFYWGLLYFVLKRASAIHCTGEAEAAAVRSLIPMARTFIAPLGCKLPSNVKPRIAKSGERIVLFLGRISEEKGLELLLDAWKGVDRDGWRLVLAGPDWRGYANRLQAKIAVEKIKRVDFVGRADFDMKDKLYRDADIFVLASPMENFSAVVLDAMAYKLPVIATKGTPWEVVEKERCGWWIEANSASAIARALDEAIKMSDEDRILMGERAATVASRYSWGSVARTIDSKINDK